MSVTIWHNPRCSKSRLTLQLLMEQGVEPIIFEYLVTPPSPKAIDDVLNKLGKSPLEAMRKKETPFDENNLGAEGLSRNDYIEAMSKNPILIERPIVIKGEKAAIGRPPEQVLDIL